VAKIRPFDAKEPDKKTLPRLEERETDLAEHRHDARERQPMMVSSAP